MAQKKNDWNAFAGIYDLFMRKDKKAYREMYSYIREVIIGKDVLELATGTGLIAGNVAEVSKTMLATDFAEKMIENAKKKWKQNNLSFEIADATSLKYEDKSFDVVIISNALHIMPNPPLALSEIKRVLKDDGVLIAPTFTHKNMSFMKRVLSKTMSLFAGFETNYVWTPEEYVIFLEDNGWIVITYKTIKASFPLTYTQCQKKE